jgi:xanthine/uracil/vitamin C permease (AzgA family)
MTEEQQASHASRLFDLRYLIGGLFTFYGVLLIIVGITDSQAQINKAAGVHINFWTGLGMLVLGLIFLGWARLRPLHPPEPGQSVQQSGVDSGR